MRLRHPGRVAPEDGSPARPASRAALVRRSVIAAAAGALTVGVAAPSMGALPTAPTAAVVTAVDQTGLGEALATAAPTDRLVVFVHGTDVAAATAAARTVGLEVLDTFDRVGIVVAAGVPSAIATVAAQVGVTKVEPDAPIDLLMETSHIATRGEEARTAFSAREVVGTTGTRRAVVDEIDGRGVTIAVIDSGVDGTHPMFQVDTDGDGIPASKVVRNLKHVCPSGVLIALGGPCTGDPTTSRSSTGKPYGDAHDGAFVDLTHVGNDTDTLSNGGHGTHVAGIAAGVDVTSVDGREVHGAAPGAELVALSVGQTVSVYGGAAGMNWVLEHHDDPCGDGSCGAIRVVNNSWGSGGPYEPDSALAKIQDALVDAGVVVVWAAGNEGGDGSDDRVNPPAKSPTPGILNVASYDDGNTGTRDGVVSDFSSRGDQAEPTTYPDIAAPGTQITSACRIHLPVCSTGLDLADPDYNTIGGTSMAAPHVAGVVAQLLQVDPSLTPGQIEVVLEATAHEFADGAEYVRDPRHQTSYTSFDKGHGLVDVVAAVESILGLAQPEPDGAD